MKNKKNKIKNRSEETEEDKRIIDIMCKLGGLTKEKFGYILALKHREAKDLLEKKEIQTRLFEKTKNRKK